MDSKSRYFFASLKDVDVVVTDPKISKEHLRELSRAGIRVLKEVN
jgi:DeoR/GlpR family transcriptional regulator of sugar metabolism